MAAACVMSCLQLTSGCCRSNWQIHHRSSSRLASLLTATVYVFAGVSSQLVLPAVARYQFTSLAEVNKQPDDVHCFPKKKNLQSVDFLRQPDDMGQVTIDLYHGAKATGLRAAHNVLRAGQSGQAVHLTFVVPSDRYDNFPKQKIGKIDLKRYPIIQRVLKIPLSGRALALLL